MTFAAVKNSFGNDLPEGSELESAAAGLSRETATAIFLLETNPEDGTVGP